VDHNTKTFPNVILSTEGPVAIITLNRPRVFNAISPDLMRDLKRALSLVSRDKKARAVIITGAGSSFCAGGDIEKDVMHASRMTPLEYAEYNQGFFTIIDKVINMEKPVIAAINGYAVGGGFDIALACDIRIAAEGSRMGNAYIKMGLVPQLGGLHFLTQIIGPANAKQLLFTGDFIPAQEAYRMGLVAQVVPDDKLANASRELAEKLANGPTRAIAMTKLAVNRSLNSDLHSSTEHCQSLAVGLFRTEDHKEAVAAFREKRKPVFKGK